MRAAAPGAIWMLALACLLAPVPAEVFLGDVHTTVTVLDTHYWSGIELKDGQSLEYTVKVLSGDAVNVHLMDDSRLNPFLNGSTVPTVNSDENVQSAGFTHSSAGRYALIIDNGYGESVCKVDLVVRSADTQGGGTSCVVIGLVAFIVLVAVAAAVVLVMRRRRPAPPHEPGATPQQYGAQPYQQPAPQYAPPPQYPAAPQYQPAQAQYQAPAPAGYQARYTPPPAPGAPGQMAQCKYCDFQMPAGTQVCPRCGGFN